MLGIEVKHFFLFVFIERHNLTVHLRTFLNVLCGSLSKHTVNVLSSRTLILALTALSEG